MYVIFCDYDIVRKLPPYSKVCDFVLISLDVIVSSLWEWGDSAMMACGTGLGTDCTASKLEPEAMGELEDRKLSLKFEKMFSDVRILLEMPGGLLRVFLLYKDS